VSGVDHHMGTPHFFLGLMFWFCILFHLFTSFASLHLQVGGAAFGF
jgi:hypothetical protein